MIIKEITRQFRRDFIVIMECDHCGNVEEGVSGYDDNFFHKSVVPTMKCKKCHKIAKDNYRPLQTRYKRNEVV